MSELNELAGGRYLIQEPLGEGGSGSIFRAFDKQLGRGVALKRIKEDPLIATSIRDEAAILAALDHPNVVTVFDYGSDEGGQFVVMELLNGKTLEEMVHEKPLTVAEFLPIMNEICRGLAAAHAVGLVHCDLKPGNIMLQCHHDKTFTTKVLDFGLATASISTKIPDSAPRDGIVIQGSALTISPEQLNGHPMDIRSDIYSLGCTFYFALSGVYAHDADDVLSIAQSHLYNTPKPLHEANPEVPEAFSLAIMKMIEREPDHRPQDAEAVRVSLLEGAHAQAPAVSIHEAPAPAPVSAPPPAPPETRKPTRLRIQLLVLLLVSTTTYWIGNNRNPKLTAERPPSPQKTEPNNGPTPSPSPTPARHPRPYSVK